MRLELFSLVLLATMIPGCAAPDVKDPMAGLGAGGSTAVPTSNPDYKALTVGLIPSENTKNTIDYLNRSNISKYIEIDERMEDFAGVFEKHFKGVVKIARIEDAAEARADLVAVMDIYAHYHSTIYQTQGIDAKVLLLSPDRTQIDIVAAAGTRKGSDVPPTGRGKGGFRSGPEAIALALGQAILDARDRVEQGLFASQKLQDFARSAAAGKPEARATVPTAPAAAPPAPNPAAAPAPRVVAAQAASDVDSPTRRSPERPNDFALVIGIEEYQNLPKADYGERDAATVRKHYEALGVPARNIIALNGPQATGSKLRSYLQQWLPRNVKPESTVFVYYSGHGAPDPASGDAYLVPWDADPMFLTTSAYPLKQFYSDLSKLKARRVLVALDACFSGSGGRSVLAKGARPLVVKVDESVPADANLTVLAAASGSEITGSLDEQAHGIFTYYYLKGLSSGAKTPRALFDYLKPKVQDDARRQNREQSPTLSGGGADVAF